MKIIFRFVVGIANAFMLISIFWNKDFMSTFAYVLNVAGARRVESLIEFGTQIVFYTTFALVAGYCFSNKLRNIEKYWNVLFSMNCIGLIFAFVMMISIRFTTSFGSGAGYAMLAFVPIGLLYLLNVAFLLSTAKRKLEAIDENEI